jgi:hypothetical protein
MSLVTKSCYKLHKEIGGNGDMSKCENCGGEDCVCCEVYQENRADSQYPSNYYGDEYYESVEYHYERDEEDF